MYKYPKLNGCRNMCCAHGGPNIYRNQRLAGPRLSKMGGVLSFPTVRVHLLLRHGVQPYLVFDGGYLPAKAGKEEERRARRATNMQRGKQLLREGNASGAHQFFSKAADVTPLMAHQLIQVVQLG